MNGSASRPSSATMNGTRWAISPATNATSRDRRSSLETRTQHRAVLAAASAAASWGRRSSASAPLPVSASTNSAMILRFSAWRSAGRRPAAPRSRAQSAGVAVWRHDSRQQRDPYKGHTIVCLCIRRHTFVPEQVRVGHLVEVRVVGATRQTTLPTSSATRSAPLRSISTPTGRPRAVPSSFRKPDNTSTGLSFGFPS